MTITDDDLLAAIAQYGSQRKAAEALGIPRSTIGDRMRALALRGYSPAHDMTHTVPDGFKVRGVSTYYNKDGQPTGQWVKSAADDARREVIMREAMDAIAEGLPKVEPRMAAGDWDKRLLTVYPIGDPHIGMLAWREETGDTWDLRIAENTHCEAMSALVDLAPATERAVIVNLGDLLHYDSMEAKTPRSGHLLEADGRYAKMIRVGVRVMLQCIESALGKHKEVHVVSAIGNHDETGALWLALLLSHVYADEPRVTVDTSPAVFNYYRFGKVLLGVHHGHTCKPDKLPAVMAADRAKDWGETEHRYWICGHIHHASMKEYPGVQVESFGTLAGKDAYAANGGWRSQRNMQAIVYHCEFGEVARSRVVPDMFQVAA